VDTPRRIERERVLELLYEAEIKNIPVDELLADLPTTPEPFVIELVRGVSSQADSLDAEIQQRALNWDLSRIATLDRLILRMGFWELTYRPETPLAVVISEAVELAKQFSTDESGKFINGILGSMQTDA
jgi:transcription antitermination protein NusB